MGCAASTPSATTPPESGYTVTSLHDELLHEFSNQVDALRSALRVAAERVMPMLAEGGASEWDDGGTRSVVYCEFTFQPTPTAVSDAYMARHNIPNVVLCVSPSVVPSQFNPIVLAMINHSVIRPGKKSAGLSLTFTVGSSCVMTHIFIATLNLAASMRGVRLAGILATLTSSSSSSVRRRRALLPTPLAKWVARYDS
jgi:hypothetical protein